MYNYSMLIGRLCADVKVRNTTDGKKVSNLRLAVTRPFKNNQTDEYDADFIDVSVWDELCDIASTYLRKGSLIAVKGRLTSKYVTLDTGAIISVVQLVGEKVVFISSPDSALESTNE